MSENPIEGRIALQLVCSALALLKVKRVLSRAELLGVFEAAQAHYASGSPEAEALHRIWLSFAEMPPHQMEK